MKKASRFLALLLAALMLASCSNGGEAQTESTSDTPSPSNSPESAAAETESNYISDDLPDTDFGGADFRIQSCQFYSKELATYLTMDEMTGVPVDDALYESKMYLEDRFKVAISWIESAGQDEAKVAAKNSINAGDPGFEIIINQDHAMAELSQGGYFRDLKSISQFNFDKPWWPSHAVDSWTVAGKMAMASNYMSYCGLHWTRAITVNKDWAEKLQMEIPYDAVREGKWTLDMLNRLTEDVSFDVNGNGKIDADDDIGFVSGSQTWYCLQEGVDLPIYRRDESGNVYMDLDIDRADRFLEIMRTLTSKDRYTPSGDFGVDAFKNGKALFAYTQVGDAYDYYRISDVRYGFLPTPKLDEAQESYINCCTDVPWAIPKTVVGESETFVGTICEAMSCYNYNHVIPAYFEGALKSRAADSADDTEMLQIIADTRTIGFAYAYSLQMSNILGDIMNTSQGAASYFKSKEKAASKMLDKLVMQFEEME